MSGALVLLSLYGFAIAAMSLLGGFLPAWVRMTHTRTQMIMSAVAGLMLGVACFHLIPHAVPLLGETGALDRAMAWTMAGLAAMLLLLRAFHFHQHDYVLPEAGLSEDAHDHHHHHEGSGHSHAQLHPMSWLGVALGLGLHSLIDGVALGAVVLGEAEAGISGALGIGVFAAILLHKPLDAMSITGVVRAAGGSPTMLRYVNIGFALLCPLGALMFFLGADLLPGDRGLVVGAALAFSAGTFICIALSDLLPEVHFHSHDRLKLTAAFLAGITVAYAISFLEPPRAHGYSSYQTEVKVNG